MSRLEASAPQAVQWIVRELDKAGHDTWAVGGAVRDMLLERPSDDWDLATSARPEQVRKVFRRTVPLGVDYGTVGVLSRNGTLYEVTTFRRDVETDGRHAVVSFADTIEEDLARRDFTINAVAWHPLRWDLVDPFGGVDDLQNCVLRTVGVPEERFREDYLRILRALRFAGLFNLEIERETWTSLSTLVSHLESLSTERIRDELLKVLAIDSSPGRALQLYAKCGALSVLYPELHDLQEVRVGEEVSRWTLSVSAVEELPIGRPMLRLAALLCEPLPVDVEAFLMRLRFSNAAIAETIKLTGSSPFPRPEADGYSWRRWLSAIGPERVPALARLGLARAKARQSFGMGDDCEFVVSSWRRAKVIRSGRPPLLVSDLALDGRGLISIGLKPGPHFAQILGGLLDWVLQDPERNQHDLLVERAVELAADITDE